MIVFNPPYSSLRQLGQASAVPQGAPVVGAPPISVLTPPSVVTVSDGTSPYDAPLTFSTAGVVVAGVVAIGLTLTVATALLRRK